MDCNLCVTQATSGQVGRKHPGTRSRLKPKITPVAQLQGQGLPRKSCVIARQMSTNSGQPGWGQSLAGREAATAPQLVLQQHNELVLKEGLEGHG